MLVWLRVFGTRPVCCRHCTPSTTACRSAHDQGLIHEHITIPPNKSVRSQWFFCKRGWCPARQAWPPTYADAVSFTNEFDEILGICQQRPIGWSNTRVCTRTDHSRGELSICVKSQESEHPLALRAVAALGAPHTSRCVYTSCFGCSRSGRPVFTQMDNSPSVRGRASAAASRG